MVWTKLFDLAICFFEGYMYYTLWSHFLKLRVKKAWFSICVLSVTSISLFCVNQLHIAGLNLAVAMVLSMIACCIMFIDTFKKKIFYVLLSGFVLICCEFIMGGIFSVNFGKSALTYDNQPVIVLLVTISSKLLSYVVIRLICHVSGNGKNLFFASLAPYFSVFPIACFVMYIGIAYSPIDFEHFTFGPITMVVGCVLLWIANIVLFIVYDRMTYMMNRVKEYELTDFKSQLENQHYKQIEEMNRKHSEIIHDMGNYLKTIERLAVSESNEKIVEFIESLNEQIIDAGEEYYCNHQILNAILNGKKQDAAIKGVDYKVYVEMGFEKPDVNDCDLISIISNLIDNAIEAASKCKDGYVDVQMYKANDGRFITLKITNNYKEKPLEKNGEFVSRKQNPALHGIGIRHVRSIVEHYGGWTNIEYGDNKFTVTIMFA
ncbi:MAG: sensor histidine kinase [Hungatella hathewayi]|nr:sensor histidine kinase [Hungatella hathewayi]